MATKYSSVSDSLFIIEEGIGVKFKDLEHSAWHSTPEQKVSISNKRQTTTAIDNLMRFTLETSRIFFNNGW